MTELGGNTCQSEVRLHVDIHRLFFRANLPDGAQMLQDCRCMLCRAFLPLEPLPLRLQFEKTTITAINKIKVIANTPAEYLKEVNELIQEE